MVLNSGAGIFADRDVSVPDQYGPTGPKSVKKFLKKIIKIENNRKLLEKNIKAELI